MINSVKRGSADLLLEIIISSILFFVIVIILFGIQAPVMRLNAAAHVVSADAALGCEMSLTNMLKATSPKGITYSDWLMNSYLADNKPEIDSWSTNVKNIFDKTFQSSYWNMSITLPNGTNITPMLGDITHGTKYDIFNCETYIPYPVAYMRYYCYPEIPPQEAVDGQTLTFKTPEGVDISCTFIINNQKIGIEPNTCSLDLKQSQKSIFAEDLQSYIDNDASTFNVLVLPVLVSKKIPYEITVQETEEASKVLATLEKRAIIEDCSLHLTLMTTNISASETFAAAT